jgi:hypothetical protein
MQYLSLIHFLASGGYQNPYGDSRRRGNRSVTHVDHWDHDWVQYYDGVVQQIKGYLNGRYVVPLIHAYSSHCKPCQTSEKFKTA